MESTQDMIGRVIGGYKLEEFLGSGGVAEVYLGRHEDIGTLVAVKIAKEEVRDEPAIMERFWAEATILDSLSGINHILGFRQIVKSEYAIIVEFAGRKSFQDCISNETSWDLKAIGRDLGVIEKVVDALIEAHERGVTHRDLKPENVMVSDNEEEELDPRVIDFNISKRKGGKKRKHETTADKPVGTIIYSATEQLEDAPNVDGRADIFAIWMIVYLLFNKGEHFYGSDEELSMEWWQLMGLVLRRIREPAFIKSRLERIFPEVAILVKKGIHPDPDQRMQTMREVKEALMGIRVYLKLREKGIITGGENKTPVEPSTPSVHNSGTMAWSPSTAGAPPFTPPPPERQAAETVTSEPEPSSSPTDRGVHTAETTVNEEPALEQAQVVEATPAKKGLSMTTVILLVLVAMGATLGLTLALTRKGKPAGPAKAKTETEKVQKPKPKPMKPRPKPMAKPVMARPMRPIVKLVVKVRPKPVKPRPVDPCKRAKGTPPSDKCLALKCKRKGRSRPSTKCIALHYEKAKHGCRKTDPKRGQFEEYPNYLLSCLNTYADKLRGGKYSKDFRKVSMAVLFLDEARTHFCFDKRYRACSGPKYSTIKPNYSRRSLLWGKCWNVHYKVVISHKRYKDKRGKWRYRSQDNWLIHLTADQRKKVKGWLGKSSYLRRQNLIRQRWVADTLKKYPLKMACLKK